MVRQALCRHGKSRLRPVHSCIQTWNSSRYIYLLELHTWTQLGWLVNSTCGSYKSIGKLKSFLSQQLNGTYFDNWDGKSSFLAGLQMQGTAGFALAAHAITPVLCQHFFLFLTNRLPLHAGMRYGSYHAATRLIPRKPD